MSGVRDEHNAQTPGQKVTLDDLPLRADLRGKSRKLSKRREYEGSS